MSFQFDTAGVPALQKGAQYQAYAPVADEEADSLEARATQLMQGLDIGPGSSPRTASSPASRISPPSPTLTEQNLSRHVQSILKIYKTPMPQDPVISAAELRKILEEEGERKNLFRGEKPSAADRAEALALIAGLPPHARVKISQLPASIKGVFHLDWKEDRIPGVARDCHGSIHAVRATLFSVLFLELNKSLGFASPSERDFAVIPALAALHDTGRELGGFDHWDDISGEIAREYFQQLSAVDAAEAQRVVSGKDDEESPRSLAQKAVHDADCTDIMRLRGIRDRFEAGRLDIMKEACSAEQKEQITAFLAEAKRFIADTQDVDKENLVKAVEDSADAYKFLCEFLVENRTKYPMMYALMEKKL